ncbi:MAG: hydrogenase iron-sulfur subunit [Chloroflexi bacterium]|nr:hydrogenase iron-sulfur subunit [Chloroflexota bacterium]
MTEFSQKGVYLCDCQGRLSRAVPIDAIRLFLEERQSGLKVVVGDKFCEPRVLSGLVQEHGLQPTVVGACSQFEPRLHLWQEPERASVDPYSIRIVDLLREISSSYSPTDLTGRIKLLLWAQLARQATFTGVPQQALKVQFGRPHGEISRRQLFDMLVPRYQVVPYVQREKCVGTERCRLCRENCPSGAIVAKDGGVQIDKKECHGCGSCAALCLHQSISYPNFSLDQLEREMEGLLCDIGSLEPRILALACQSCRSSPNNAEVDPLGYSPNMLLLEMPCLDMISFWLLLRAFDLGAQGVAFISNKENCRLGRKPEKWPGRVQFVQALLQRWDIEPGRIGAFEVGDLKGKLTQFLRQIEELPPTPLRSFEPATLVVGNLALPELIVSVDRKLEPARTEAISAGAVPFGKVQLDSSQCTACGLCALDCPTGALKFLSDEGSCRLLFEHRLCLGCGQCMEACPERCLHLENTLEIDRLCRAAEAIFESRLARCQECGASVAPKAMIDKLRTRIAAGQGLTSHLEVCPACRAKAMSRAAANMIGV